MRPLLLIFFCFIGCQSIVFAQDFASYSRIPLKEAKDFRKVEHFVLESCDFILKQKVQNLTSGEPNYAALFLLSWMEGSPDYTFEIDELLMSSAKKNNGLFAVGLASMSKYMLENKIEDSNEEVKVATAKSICSYIESNEEEIKMSRYLKGLLKACRENRLPDYLGQNE